MVAVKLPDTMPGSHLKITNENKSSLRVLEWLVILVGCKINYKSELEVRQSKSALASLRSL